tara:strand:+ start:235 stop:609 length:375 start_codon:yes stop_codon:yes gene_type:complete
MTKKTNKKTATKKSVKKSVNKKPKQNKDDNFGSSGVLILAIIGIVVLIYFGANTDIKGDKQVKKEVKTEQTTTEQEQEQETAIVIGGRKYPSKEYALKALKDVPQTQLTEEERRFVINPDGFTN